MSRYLTKSRFKVAYECPAKLFYNEQPKVYGNNNRDNEFLKALAQGGFQVGALAKLYYPGGVDLEGLKTEEAITRTRALLGQEKVILFEAAIQTGPFLIRVDVLIKDGNAVSLIEVKSSSFDSTTHTDFFKKRDPGIDGDWEPYVVDVSFQTWVANQAYPEWRISSFLMLANKAVKASVDGLHQCFRLDSSDQKNGRVIVRDGITKESLGEEILTAVPVDREVSYVISQDLFPNGETLPSFANYLAKHHVDQTKALARVSSICKRCEFRIGPEQKSGGLKSAFEECWTEAGKLRTEDKDRALIFDIWDCKKTEDLLAHDKVFFDQLVEEDLTPKSKSKKVKRLERYQRQWIQIEKRLENDPTPYIDKDGLDELFESITFPIHCIDFETSMVAIPFHRGRRPYEQIAFQFSHHILEENGEVAHVDQYLSCEPGLFPNFSFLRALKASLSKDQGTIFRYASHENTVLRQIRQQLIDTPEPDAEALISFVDSITKPRGGEDGEAGRRNMIDLRDVVLDHYFHPLMGGSNSIKKVIPAVLQESDFLRQKYASPIYGKGKKIESLNFEEMKWIELDAQGLVRDPYKRLPPVFEDIPQETFSDEAPLFHDDSIDDGGAAMTAWSRMQFTEMTRNERSAISAGLLKYCELDTLSMVWLLEYFRHTIRNK